MGQPLVYNKEEHISITMITIIIREAVTKVLPHEAIIVVQRSILEEVKNAHDLKANNIRLNKYSKGSSSNRQK